MEDRLSHLDSSCMSGLLSDGLHAAPIRVASAWSVWVTVSGHTAAGRHGTMHSYAPCHFKRAVVARIYELWSREFARPKDTGDSMLRRFEETW